MAKKAIGELIRDLRTDRGVGVRELGRLVEVTGVHISNIEKGKATPSPELLTKIGRALGADVDELLSVADQVDPALLDVIKSQPQVLPSFLRSAQNLSKEQWELLQKQVQEMTEKGKK
jgi:transcriptional regulator with XRE-family HTH domain